MSLSDKNIQILKGALLSHGGMPLKIMQEWMDELILTREKKISSKGNLLEDIPFMYKRDGAIKMLKSLRSDFDDMERGEKEDAEKAGE